MLKPGPQSIEVGGGLGIKEESWLLGEPALSILRLAGWEADGPSVSPRHGVPRACGCWDSYKGPRQISMLRPHNSLLKQGGLCWRPVAATENKGFQGDLSDQISTICLHQRKLGRWFRYWLCGCWEASASIRLAAERCCWEGLCHPSPKGVGGNCEDSNEQCCPQRGWRRG